MGSVDIKWCRIRADGFEACCYPREINPTFHDRQCSLGIDITSNWDGLIGGTVPANRRRLGTVGTAGQKSIANTCGRDIKNLRKSRYHSSAVIDFTLKHHPVNGNHQRGAIGNKWSARLIQNQPSYRRCGHLAHGIALRSLPVTLASYYLKIEQPHQ